MLLTSLSRAVVLTVLLTLSGPAPGVSDATPPQHLPVAPHTSEMTVASYNVCAANCPSFAPWGTRVPRIVERIAAQHPAVVAVQEAGGREEVRLLDRLMRERGLRRVAGLAARYVYVDPKAVEVLRSGVVTAQRTPRSKKVRLPWVDLRDRRTGRVLSVANLHLTATDGRAKDLDRLYEVRSLTKVLAGRERIVMVGDTNSLSRGHSAGYDADHHRWRVHSWLTQRGWGASTGRGTYIQDAEVDHRRLGPLAFDRAYAKGLRVDRFRVLPGGRTLSDHRAVVAVVQPRLPLSVTPVREDDPRGR